MIRSTFLRRAAKGTEIYTAGDPAGRLIKVCRGAVILYVLLEDGRRQIVDLTGPGDLLCFETEGIRDHFAEALMDTELAEFDASEAVGDPDFLPYYLEQVRTRFALERRHITMLGRQSAAERLEEFLDQVADCLGCPPGKLDLPMTRQQIADYLGLTLETVSRLFARWEREGRVTQTGPGRYDLRNIKAQPLRGVHAKESLVA